MAKQVITITIVDDSEIKDGELVKAPELSGKLGVHFHMSNADDDGSFSFQVAEGLSVIFPTVINNVTAFAIKKVEQDNRKIIRH